ncbi:MAG: serine/threonine protein kinase, partial [Actinomycetota bacterium]|nr:serine/threonine protein kinase [Actinomycetota bacterium]
MSTSATPSPPPSLARGLPERYHLRRHIATGGMASVWCADDRVLGRQVAIKVLADRFVHDEVAVRRFKREARAAARVSAHPHVVTIFDVGDLQDPQSVRNETLGAFIVMEHLAGGTVADALRHDAVTREETRRWLRDAAEALDHAHARGIVHRDIKPANFLLDQNRSVHVADFGIARLASEDTISSAGELFGTAAYLAPEQALGRDATAASDRYALAVAAFELLTGGRPFTATHFAAQARQHIDDPPPRASQRDASLPSAVDDVLARGMAKDPADRYPSAAAFVAALETALDDLPTARTTPRAVPVPVGPSTAVTAPHRAAAGSRARNSARVVPAAAPEARSQRSETPRSRSTEALPSRAPGRRGNRRAIALAALLLGVLGVVAVLVAALGGSGSSPTLSRRAAAPSHRTTSTATATTRHHRASSSASASASASASSSTSASTTTPAGASSTASTPAPVAAGSPTAVQLQLLGYHARLAGNYPA